MNTTFDQALQLYVARFDRVTADLRKILLTPGYNNNESPEMKTMIRHFNESIADIFILKGVIAETGRLLENAPDSNRFTCVVCQREFTDKEEVKLDESKTAQSAQHTMPGCRIQPMALMRGKETHLGNFEILATCWKCWDRHNIPVAWISGKRESQKAP